MVIWLIDVLQAAYAKEMLADRFRYHVFTYADDLLGCQVGSVFARKAAH